MFYQKGVDISNTKSMFNFLNNHFTYDTLNSWNGLRSIANNVKVYNLKLEGDEWTALAFLEDDEYFTINEMIRDWEITHRGYSVGFNGRSGGYLVLYNDNNNCNVIPDRLYGYDSYEDFKEDYKYYGTMKDAKYELREYTKLVQDFDKLCDQLRDYVNTLSKLDFMVSKIHDRLDDFNYDYKDDMNYVGVEQPKLKAIDTTTTNETCLITIDPEMRQYRALMECFIKAITHDMWDVIDDGSNIIKLEAN